jgi:dihydroorotate dehydrogenase
MSWCYRHVLRPALFTQDAEAIHETTLRWLGRVGQTPLVREALGDFLGAPPLPVEAFGLRFPNPIGLAAGMDKDAHALPAWAALGFGFLELGTVTWLPQPGNPRPRLFRAIPAEAIVNRMGFNNAGAVALAQALGAWRSDGHWPAHPVGVNLGKSKVTPLAEAAADYANSLRALWAQGDFFIVNVSSPNTPNLRELQEKSALDEILAALREVNLACARAAAPRAPHAAKPILVKVAPDLTFAALDQLLELAGPRQLAGIVATNTTISRPDATRGDVARVYAEAGGLSGRPLRDRSTEVIRHIFRQTRGKLPVIGVGGVFSAADAWEKITAGATLVELYTALVYAGPWLVQSVVTGLLERLAEAGLPDLRAAVGLAAQP